jgi:hypothetical protein
MENEKDRNWRQLCAIARHENDPVKLASLVSQILQVFEEHDNASLSVADRDL